MKYLHLHLFALGLLLSLVLGLSLACQNEESATDASLSPAVKADEEALAQEKKPDFSSPQIVDSELQLQGLPETLVWYTSKPGVFGSSRAKSGGTYRDWISEFPDTFRTVGPNSNGSFRGALGNGYSLLEINNETKEWIPALASDWAFGSDKKTVYYKLNEKVRWTDGSPVTSKDYLFMLKMMRSPYIQAPYYNDYFTSQITDIKAYGDYVISVTASEEASPDDLLLGTTVSPRPSAFYNNEIKEDYIDAFQWTFEPSTGPYALSSFEKGESVTFSKVKDWWGYCYDYNKYRYNVETIQYTVITGGIDIVKKYFYDGQLDTFPFIIPQLWQEISVQEAVEKGYIERQEAYYVPIEGISGIYLNVRKPPLDKKEVRQGLYYAINMQKMLDTVLQGAYSRYHNIGLGHVFAGITFDDDSLRIPDFDPVKAGELFAQAGYDQFDSDGIRKDLSGNRLSIELLYSAQNHTERLAVLKEEAKKAGLNIDLKLMQEGVFTAVLEKKFQAWWGALTTSIYPDYWQMFHSVNANIPQTNNFFDYADPEMDKLLDAARAASDLQEKARITKEIQRKVHDEALVIPNYYVPFNRGAAWKWWRFPAWLGQKFDAEFYSPGTGGGYLWLDEAIKEEVMSAMDEGRVYPSRLYENTTWKME